jgi:hypothetical protein
MKKIIRNNRILLIAFFTIFSGVALAIPPVPDKSKEVPVELTYAGSINNQPLFQLSFFGNPEQNDFTINIVDETGYSLFSENFKAEVFTRKFLLNTSEILDETLNFEIISHKTGKTVIYKINRYTRNPITLKK